MSTSQQPPTEEELRAAYEAEIKKIRIEQVLLEQVVSLINLGMRRTGLAPGTEDERDPGQVRLAIEAIRSLVPLLEQTAPEQIGPIKQALSQLQLAYVRVGGAPAQPDTGAAAPGTAEPGAPGAGGAPGGAPGAGEAPGGGEAPGSGGPGGQGGASEPAPPKPGEPGPAQRSGRLWVPGQ